MFRVPAVPIIRSTVLQLAVTGITSLWLGWNSTTVMWPTARFWTTFKMDVNIHVTYVIQVTVNCSTVLLMMGTAGTRNMYRSWNKTKILSLHLVGYSITYLSSILLWGTHFQNQWRLVAAARYNNVVWNAHCTVVLTLSSPMLNRLTLVL
jgi:hypothetical protein